VIGVCFGRLTGRLHRSLEGGGASREGVARLEEMVGEARLLGGGAGARLAKKGHAEPFDGVEGSA
jgi:hypothetical protein